MNPFRRFSSTAKPLQWKVHKRVSGGADAYGNPVTAYEPAGVLLGVVAPSAGGFEDAQTTGETAAPGTLYAQSIEVGGHRLAAGDYLENADNQATYMVVEAPQPWTQPSSGNTVGFSIKVRSVPQL